MSFPLVSVVMPVYNGEKHVRKAVDSILGQTFKDFELIIVDDGSTDRTPEILNEFTDARIRVIGNSTNMGVRRARNRALDAVRGKFIAVQDADDVSMPRRLEKQVQYLERHHGIALIGTDGIEFDEVREVGHRVAIPRSNLALKWHLLFQNPFIHSSVMFRTEVITAIDGYSDSETAELAEDYELWSRMLWSNHRFGSIPQPLVIRTVHADELCVQRNDILERDFRAVVRSNLRRLEPALSNDDRLTDLIWRLQVCGGFDEPLEQVEKALNSIEELVKNFGDYFHLEVREQRRVRAMAHRRAARTLLHNAQQHAYAGRHAEANEFARLALTLDKRLAFSTGYRKLQVKHLLGQTSTQRLRDTQKRIKSAIHLS